MYALTCLDYFNLNETDKKDSFEKDKNNKDKLNKSNGKSCNKDIESFCRINRFLS